MIAVIAVLIVGSNRLDTHTVALFSSGAMALGLDSYLFSGITGAQPPGGDKDQAAEVCKMVWSQGMAASGLLAVGGSVFVCGLGWMLVNHIAKGSSSHTHRRRVYLVRLAGVLTAGILTTTTGLLVSTTNIYLLYLDAPAVWSKFVIGFGVAVTLWSLSAVAWRSAAMARKVEHVAGTTDVKTALGLLPHSTFTVTGLAITATLYAGVLNLWAFGINVLTVSVAVLTGLVIPGVISVLISLSVPRPK